MRRSIIALGAAAALVSCKANLERHDYDGGDTDLGIGEKPSMDGMDGRYDPLGTGGGTLIGTGGAPGGATGGGGMSVGSGGMSGAGGAGSGGSNGSGGTASGGGGETGDAAADLATKTVDAGTDTSAAVDLSLDAPGDAQKPTDAGADAPAFACTGSETRCSGNGMQTCGADATWGIAMPCESAICSGTKCLPKSAILIAAPDKLFVYDAQTGNFSSSFAFKETTIEGASLGPDGKLWLFDLSKAIVRYDLSGTSLGVFTTTQDSGESLAFGPDGNLYVSANTIPRATILRIDVATGASMGTFVQGPLDLYMAGMIFHNGSLFVTYLGAGATGGSLYQYSGTTGAFVSILYDTFASNGPRTPAFAPDGNLYVPIWQTFDVAKFDATTLKFIANISQDNLNPTSIAVAPDGKLLVLSDPLGGSDSVQRYDPNTGTFSTFVPAGSGGLGRARAIFVR